MMDETRIHAIISLTLKLQKIGMSEEDIKEEVPKLVKSIIYK